MQRDVWEATSEQEVTLRLDFQGVPTYSWLCVNSFHGSSCLCLSLWIHWPCFISDNTHHQRQQCSSVALITATWQAPTVPSIQSHTSLKPTPAGLCVGVCARVCVRMSPSQCTTRIMRGPGIWLIRPSGPWGREEDVLTHGKLISNAVIEDRCKI